MRKIDSKLICFLLASIFMSAFVSSCRNISDFQKESAGETSYEVTLPEPVTENFYFTSTWKIFVTGIDFQTVLVLKDTDKSSFTFSSDSVYPIAVTAVPELSAIDADSSGQSSVFPFTFNEAGTVLPFSTELSFEKGFSASILKEIYEKLKLQGKNSSENGKIIQLFNWEKLVSAVETKCSGKTYNPFLLSKEDIEEKIMSGTFYQSLLTYKNSLSVSKDDIVQKANEILYQKEFSQNENTVLAFSPFYLNYSGETFTAIKAEETEIYILAKKEDSEEEYFSFYKGSVNALTAKNFSLELVKLPIKKSK